MGLNLLKGTRGSEEEFLFSENLFSVKHEDNIERFNQGFRVLQRQLSDKYDDSTAVVLNECAY